MYLLRIARDNHTVCSLEEADERYNRRESRIEDLEMIQSLRNNLFSKEEYIQKLEVLIYKFMLFDVIIGNINFVDFVIFRF